jgi:hypothetical protein
MTRSRRWTVMLSVGVVAAGALIRSAEAESGGESVLVCQTVPMSGSCASTNNQLLNCTNANYHTLLECCDANDSSCDTADACNTANEASIKCL